MPKTPSAYGSHAADYNKKSKKKERFNDNVFIQYELDEVLSKTCKDWSVNEGELFDAIERLVDSGYTLSVKHDTYNDCPSAFLRQTEEGGPNFGYILTGRGSTARKAVKQLLFKHYTVMEERWQEFAPRSRAIEIDD